MLIGISDIEYEKWQGCFFTVPRHLQYFTLKNAKSEYSHLMYKFLSRQYYLANVCLNILWHSVSQDLCSCFYVQVRLTERIAAEIQTPTNIMISEAYLANHESQFFFWGYFQKATALKLKFPTLTKDVVKQIACGVLSTQGLNIAYCQLLPIGSI